MDYLKIIVCCLKGTAPDIPGTPAHFEKCGICEVDVVMDARNVPFMRSEGLMPVCRGCCLTITDAPVPVHVVGMENGIPGSPNPVSKGFANAIQQRRRQNRTTRLN